MSKVSFSERLRDSGWRLKEKAFWRHGRDSGGAEIQAIAREGILACMSTLFKALPFPSTKPARNPAEGVQRLLCLHMGAMRVSMLDCGRVTTVVLDQAILTWSLAVPG